jgi:hypothetical protein
MTYLPQEMAKLSQRLEQFCPPWQMDTASFLRSIIEMDKLPTRFESTMKRLSLRCELSVSDRSRRDFEYLTTLAAKAALSLPQLEICELWGTCLSGDESCAYIFRYSYEGGRPRIVWRSCGEAMGARMRIMAQWSKVAQRRSHSILEYYYAPFSESKAKVFASHGTFIYRHMLLKDLVFDPITQIILENEAWQWGLDEESDTSVEDDPLDSSLAIPNSVIGDPLIDSLGVHSDIEMLHAEVIATDTTIDTFFQKYHW